MMSANTIAGFSVNQKFWLPVPMSMLKQRRGKNRACGPYYSTRKLITDVHPGKSFYLDSDFAPGLRWRWCDDVTRGIKHSGWFSGAYGDSELIRGVVFRLPGGRGFLAGWSMGEGMSSELNCYVYDDETSAAWAADSWAERVAEKEREYSGVYDEN